MNVRSVTAGFLPWALVGALAAWPCAAASPPPASDEAVYLERFARAGSGPIDSYDPLEAVPGAVAPTPLPIAKRPLISQAARDAARDYALSHRSTALLIWRDGALEQAVYGPGIEPSSPLVSLSLAKPLGAVAVGRAIRLGAIRSLDQRVVDFIPEWRGAPKAAVTVRQLLNMTSGLLEQNHSADPSNIWSRAYLHPHHDKIIINEYPLTAPPGARFQYSNTSAELIAVVIERATHRRYAEFVSSEVLAPLGAAGGRVWVDRPGGLAHSGCCISLPAESWLRLGLLLLDDGRWGGRQLLPQGYVTEMRTPSADNPRYGLGVWIEGRYIARRGFAGPGRVEQGAVLHSEPYVDRDLFLFDGNADQVLYMSPSRRLAILRMGAQPPKSMEWDNSYLPNLILRDLAGSPRSEARP